MARLGASEPSSTGKTVFGVVLILAALGILAGIGYVYFMESRTPGLTEDLCPADGPSEHLVILVDTTDPVTRTQLQLAHQRIDKEIQDVPVGTRLSFSTVNPDLHIRQSAFTSLCKPPSGDEVSEFSRNPRMVQEQYEKDFRKPVDDALARLLAVPEAPSSPIMESLQEFASSIPGFTTTESPRKVVLMSDLIQHSAAFSFYRGGSWRSFSDAEGPKRFGTAFINAEITILRIPRNVEMHAIVDDFWVRYLSQQGFKKTEITLLGDL